MGTIGNLWYRGWTTDWSEWTRPMCRLLVLLTTLLILVMPVTEHLCNWDHFLRGGQDVEFNLLAGLLFAAMVVLSMSGTMVQPLLMRPAFATMTGSSDQVAPRTHALRGSSQQTIRVSSRLLSVDDPASSSGSCMLMRLRI